MSQEGSQVLEGFHPAASLRSGRIWQLPRRVLGGRTRTVQAAWEHTTQPTITFWHIPQVHQRANRLVSGDLQVDYIAC